MHVREEHCKMSHCNLPPPRLQSDPQIPPQYQLQFMNKVKNTTFTTDIVRDENGHPIKVAIYDTYAKPKSIISPDNSLSSAKVRLILLNAEFCTNRVNWSPSEFDQKVLTGREKKGPILVLDKMKGGSLIIQLVNGVGSFENFVFTDNSSWTKSGFRLGVMVEGEGEKGYLNGERVQEAVSESIRVRDRRGKALQKPVCLKLTHSVQCIKKIGKDRAFRLGKEKIETVEDFVKWSKNDEPALRKILGIKSESSKEWESMVEDVKQCDDEYDAKCIASNNSSQPQQALVDPSERNMSLGTNGGHCVVGSGSSEPIPSDNIIEANVFKRLPIQDLLFEKTNFLSEWECDTKKPFLHMWDGYSPPELSVDDQIFDDFAVFRPHAASTLHYNKSFLSEGCGGGGGGNYGGGGGGSGIYGGGGSSSGNYGGGGGGSGGIS